MTAMPPDGGSSKKERFVAADQSAQENFASTDAGATQHACKKSLLKICIAMRDDLNQPMADVPYRLTVGEQTWEASTKADGMVVQEVPATSETGELAFWRDGDKSREPEIWELGLAEMDPLAMASGQESRLENLAFDARDEDGVDQASLDEHLFYFRLWAGLPDDGDAQPMLARFYDPSSTEEPFDFLAVEAEEEEEADI
ncbi:MAG TPA: hypothetical protein VJ276_00945 [Thermoanaerobaculia bacterium]|nr:hypothetical protein [Thermoanaerobaculia bacterium]